MTFERIAFECVDGWTVQDINGGIYSTDVGSGVTGSTMPAQEVRQYLYVLTPKQTRASGLVTPLVPGSVIPLGRLDISWTTSFGEPGRLLTSVSSSALLDKVRSTEAILS